MSKPFEDTHKDFINKIEETVKKSLENDDFNLYDILNLGANDHIYQEDRNYYGKLFYDDLRIIGGAFSVLEKFTNTPLLLFRKNENKNLDVKDSDFFWFPYEFKYYDSDQAKLIDTTFLSTRDSQRLEKTGPDFLRYINLILNNNNKPKLAYKYNEYTNKLEMHNSLPVIYCDSAELIIFCLSYILILEKFRNENEDCSILFPEKSIELSSFTDSDSDIVKFILQKKEGDFFSEFIDKIKCIENNEVYSRLGIEKDNNNLKNKLEDIICNEFKVCSFKFYDDCLGKIHKIARFPIIPYLLIYWYKNLKNNNIWPCHLVFPIWSSFSFQPNISIDNQDNPKPESKVIFALLTVDDYFYISEPKHTDNLGTNFTILSRIIHKLGYITSDTIFYSKFATKNVLKHALSSAISQIFARNFAHNIGSHVAIRATNKEVKKRIKELYNGIDINQTYVVNWIDYMSEKLDLLEINRNEFLAEHKLPPKNMMFYREVVLPFCENTLLMDNIAHSEGIGYKKGDTCCNNLKIKVFINRNGKNEEIKATYNHLRDIEGNNGISYPDKFPYLLKSEEAFTIEDAISKKELSIEDIEICLASEHSLYSILENFIRNSAKHNKIPLKGKELIINLEISDNNDDYYLLKIYDNISAISGKELKGFQDKIEDSLITSDGEIERKNLGIADLKINAHLLRSETEINNRNLVSALKLIYRKEYDNNSQIDDTNRYNELNEKVKAKFADYNNKSELIQDNKVYNFGYELKLCKPRKVVWIGIEPNGELRKKGIITYKSIEDFKSQFTSDREDYPLANYQFAILELTEELIALKNNSPDYEWDDFLNTLPHRVLLNSKKDTIKDYLFIENLIKYKRIWPVDSPIQIPPTKNESGEIIDDWDFTFLKLCWEEWLSRWDISEKKKGRLIVNLEVDSQANLWKDKINISSLVQFDLIPDNNISSNISDGDKLVFYDRHAQGNADLIREEKINNNPNEYILNRSYLNFDKSSLDYINLFYPDSNKNNNTLYLLEAFDAGLKRIAILDERITEMLLSQDEKNIKKEDGFNSKCEEAGDYGDLANNGNVIIFSHFNSKPILSNTPDNFDFSFNEVIKIKKLTNILLPIDNEDILSDQFSFDALIIHRTYLVELLKYKNENQQKELMNSLYNKFKRVIVISGGGYPHSINFKVNFKPYSQLKNNFIKYPSKISLTQII